MPFFKRPLVLICCRFLAILFMTVWVGGFMFYGGIVIPILDEAFGQLETGMSVTRYVTQNLNLIGFCTIIVWGMLILVEGFSWPYWTTKLRVFTWLVSGLALFFLMAQHAAMSAELDRHGVANFKPSHRLYLKVITCQWLCNLALILLTIWHWTAQQSKQSTEDPTRGSTASLG